MAETLFQTFPSIVQFRNIIKDINHNSNTSTITFHGSVKLHGTNAAIGLSSNGEMWIQSRNNIITPEKDNAGFATFIHNNKEVVLSLLEKVRSKINSNVVIYGEWCGGNIQKGVGICKLPKMFVIFAIKIDEKWLSHIEMHNYECNKQHIYNIEQFHTWDIDIDFNNPQLVQNTLKDITNIVETSCPVAKSLGIDGIGEGVVWTALHPELGRLVFKVKGSEHSVSHTKTLASVDIDKLESIQEFVEYAATENRFKQGITNVYINETPDITKIGLFIKWVMLDIIKEENDTIIANGLNTKEIGSKINEKARKWFFDNYCS
jgi:hypothetical protein